MPTPLTPPVRRLFKRHTQEVLSFRLGAAHAAHAPAPLDATAAARHIASTLRQLEATGKDTVVLLGLGSGDFATRLDAALPPGASLVIVDMTPERLRQHESDGTLDALRRSPRCTLLVDTSPWAHLMLLATCGVGPDTALFRVNPEYRPHTPKSQPPQRDASAPCAERDTLTAFLRTMTDARLHDAAAAPAPAQEPTIGVAAILSPHDSGLEGFFAGLPPWLDEVIVVWDAPAPPAGDFPCAASVRHLARPLGGDFAAQRNAALAACTTDWMLTPDADERWTSQGWDALRALVRAAHNADIHAYYFPRRTLFPDEEAFLTGYGLWPDLQLRAVRRTPGLTYVRPVHERLHGIGGPVGISCGAPLLHLSRLLKDDTALRQKLAVFDAAAGGGIAHRLHSDYPCMPVHCMDEAQTASPTAFLRLPHPPEAPSMG